MCGRFTLRTPAVDLVSIFNLNSVPELSPRFNIAPTQMIAAIRDAATGGNRLLEFMKWGLIPSWAKDPSIGSRMINARGETVHEKPSFRSAFKKRRCLIPADGFYEWQKLDGGKKQPWLIGLENEQTFAFAGLWEYWKPKSAETTAMPSEAEENDAGIVSCTIITTGANSMMQRLHDRMPVILPPESYDMWLSNDASPDQLKGLILPYQAEAMKAVRVSTTVNNPRHENPECVKPLAEDVV